MRGKLVKGQLVMMKHCPIHKRIQDHDYPEDCLVYSREVLPVLHFDDETIN